MPHIQAVPTWLAWNNANFTSPSGITDVNTGQPIFAGGLNAGDYFDCTNDEAANASYTTNGILYEGRYRLVNVDSGATAANVKTGTVGYLRAGTSVKTAIITSAGSGQTAGTYTIAATLGSGGGTGAIVTAVVGSGGTLTSVTVTNGGVGYSSVPTFTLAAGGTPGVIAAQLGVSMNQVTSYDQAAVTGVSYIRPIVFLNAITPGNYGFVQELGVATVLGNASIGAGAAGGNWVESTTGGTVNAPSATTSPTVNTIGKAIDLPVASNLFKVLLDGPVVQG
jgi:hypothetical protein